MSNLLFNIRFGTYHLQLDKGKYLPTITYNEYHAKKHREAGWKWFAIYCLFGKHFN